MDRRMARADATTSAEEWIDTAEENVDEWGEQSIETLLLATQEELGELTQAFLEYRNEDGYYGPIYNELNDLGPLLIQLHWAIDRHDLQQDGDQR